MRAFRSTLLVLGIWGCEGSPRRTAATGTPRVLRRDAAPVARSDPPESRWTFDRDAVGSPPAGFSFGKTGQGRPGRWIVLPDADAPSAPACLAQVSADFEDYRFPIAVVDAPALEDLRLSVRCKPVSGMVDQVCGLVFRYQGEREYYVARASARERNVRLYAVTNGRRRQLATADAECGLGRWHTLVVEAVVDRIVVTWDDARLIDHRDATFPDAGRFGLWTKSDSVTWFDDLTVVAR
jgi:hypothetical protein